MRSPRRIVPLSVPMLIVALATVLPRTAIAQECADTAAFTGSASFAAIEGNDVDFVVQIDASANAAERCSVTLTYSTSSGTATGGVDYESATNDTQNGVSGCGGGTFSITIPISTIDDSEGEGTEDFQLEVVDVASELVGGCIEGPDGASADAGLGSDSTGWVPSDPIPANHVGAFAATGSIIDNDEGDECATSVSFSNAAVLVGEGDSGTSPVELEANVEVDTGGAAGTCSVSVHYQTADGSATGGSDYTPEDVTTPAQSASSGVLSFPITVDVLGDTEVEPDETFEVRIVEVVSEFVPTILIGPDTHGGHPDTHGGVRPASHLSLPVAATVTIGNDDQPEILIDDVEVVEGDAGTTDAVFTVRAEPMATERVFVNFQTVDGTATVADGDYEAVSDQVVIEPETSQATITIPVNGDERFEEDETFTVELTGVDGGTIADGEAICTILNDDEISIVRLISPDPVSEAAGSATVVVERLQPSGDPASVRITARGGTATENEDFTPITATVNWAANEGGRRSVEIPLVDDNLAEQDETIRVRLSDPVGATLGSPSSADLVILDDDQDGEVEIVGESDPEIVIEQSADLAVRVSKTDGTPIQGALVVWTVVEGNAELTSGSPTVTGPDGVSRQAVEVPIPDLVVIQAALEQPQQEQAGSASAQQEEAAGVTFTLRARGNLDLSSDPNVDPNNLSVGGVLDFACIEPEGQFAEFCTYLFTLDDAQQAEVVRESTPREVAAQGNLMLELPQWGFREVGRRLAALRGGGSRRVEEELALVFEGQEVRLAALVNKIVSAYARLKKMDQAVADAIESSSRESDTTGDGGDDEVEPKPRMDELDPPSRWGLFVSGRLATADRDASEREEGFDADIEGLTVGVDYRLRDDLILGAAGGFLTTELGLRQDGGGLDADGYFVTGYGAWFDESFYVDGVLGYGKNSFDLTRNIDLPVPFQGATRFVAEGDTDGSQWMVNLGTGWDHAFGASSLEIYGRGSYIEADLDGYRERGAGPFSLSIQDQSLDSLLAEAGLTYGYASSRNWGVLQPQLRAALLHEFGDDSRLVRGRFIQDVSQLEFVVPTDEPDRSFANVGVGITAVTYHGRSFYLWYDTDLSRDDLEVGTFTFGARFEF